MILTKILEVLIVEAFIVEIVSVVGVITTEFPKGVSVKVFVLGEYCRV